MITEEQFDPSSFGDEDSVYAMFSKPSLIARIGDDLRGFYGDVASGAQPEYLTELANRIDDRCGLKASEG
ncbi:MAG: hypothetical protein K2Y56_16730 [Methylobacterium sp.]|uniref:hypothetical protein n=1 Tax=Methylobacterium sp. TaxID=409 RepID=UPI0025D62353|nr:hypothetical protein [Methylobacterium sp.]MBX9933155.1 hypothetical protein [Methylobacterium sp.]